jgi:hypothetical protein
MSDTSSVSSSVRAFIGRQADNLNKAKAATSSSFANILHQTQVAVGLRSQTGFTSGATYETQTLSGQTKAVLNNTLNATKAVLHIKP